MEELKEAYKENFGKYKIPKTLEKLMVFENEYGEESYSECFYLDASVYKEPDMGQYSLDNEYFERLIKFAIADGTGSAYCFWVKDKGMELEDAPIVFVGSEGHIQVIAQNLKELIKLLSFGPETMNGETFYKDTDDFEDPECAEEFREWMKDELGISAIKDMEVEESDEVSLIISNAVKTYGEAFKEWMMSLKPQYASFESYE